MSLTSNTFSKNIVLYYHKTETPIYYYKIVVDDVIQTSLIITLFLSNVTRRQTSVKRSGGDFQVRACVLPVRVRVDCCGNW